MIEPIAGQQMPPAFAEHVHDLQKLQVAVLERAQAVLPTVPEGERSRYEDALGMMQLVLAALSPRAEPDDVTGVMEPARFRIFAQLLRERRRAAKMSRERLGLRAGLSPSTIKNIERQTQTPSRTTLCRLLAVQELGLQVRDIAEDVVADPAWRPNAWLAPRYDAAALFGDMVEMLSSPGGTLEQTYVYLDHQSALDWLTLCNSERYSTSWRSTCPLNQIAARIAKLTTGGLDVIGLGAGDGKYEVRLVQELAELRPSPPDITLKLLDISHTLVNAASQHATSVLTPLKIPVVALHANFHDLARYPVLHCTPQNAHQRRVYTLLGYTMANLDDEVRFFEDLASCTAPGDLAVLDFRLGFGPPEKPEELWQADPGLSEGLPTSHHAWLSGPIRRHCPGAAQIEFETKLKTQCLVAGSYELQAVARVRMHDGSDRRFTMFRNRRYDAARLAHCLEALGWESVAILKYGSSAADRTSAVMLLRRK